MMRALYFAAALGAAVAGWPAPSAALQPTACPAGVAAMTAAELYFGRFIGGRLGVLEKDWARFVDQEISPRFPDGLTVADVAGQYRGADGKLVKEPSKVLTIMLPSADEAAVKRLADIADAYKRRFKQEAVMTVLRPACVSF